MSDLQQKEEERTDMSTNQGMDGASSPSIETDSLEDAMDTSDFPSKGPLALIVLALLLAMFTNNLDTTIIATAIPRITDEFHALDQVGWYGSAFFLTTASFQSTWGKGFKYLALKPTFLFALFVFELGSLICGVSKNSTALIVGRAIAGAGAAGMASGAFTIIAFSAPPRHRPAYMGVMGATYALAAFLGPLLGGVFTEKLSWRWCFYINLPIGGVSAVIIFFTFKTPAAARPVPASWKEILLQMDLVGTFLIMASTVCYLLALQWGGTTKPWSDSTVIGTLIGFVLLTIAFAVNEGYMGSRALLQPQLLLKRRVWTSCGFIFFISGGYFALVYYLPIYFQSVQNADPFESGIRNLPVIVGAAIFSILSGFIVSAFGVWVPLIAGGAAVGTVGCGLLYTFNLNTPSSQWIGYQALAGMGIGFTMQIPMMANQASVSPNDISSISAITLFFQIIGGAYFVSAAQSAFSNKLISRLATSAPDLDAHMALGVGATELRKVFSAAEIPGVLAAYMDGLQVAYALVVALVGISFLFALMPRWEKLRPEAQEQSKGESAA